MIRDGIQRLGVLAIPNRMQGRDEWMMVKGSVTVIIVNWNGCDYLGETLSLLSQQSLAPTRILVVDNGSTDGSANQIQHLPDVEVVFTGSNLGFAKANNLALRECDTEFVALLNPDAFPNSDWLEKLMAAARLYPGVDSFGSRLMIHGKEDILDGIGDVYHLSGLIWRDGHGRAINAGDAIPKDIFSACAGAALYRRDTFLEVGGFDEDYFCYVEDVDLGFRLRLAGYRSMYIPDSVVYHVGSASTGGQHSDFAVYHGHRNLVWTFVKNMPGILFWAFLPAHILLNMVTVIVFALRGQGSVILRSKWHAIMGLPSAWRKRKAIQMRRVVSVKEIWRILDKRILP